MKYKTGDTVKVDKRMPASGYIHDQLRKVNYIVTITEVVDIFANPAQRFYYVTDGTGKHEWFSLYEHHIMKQI